MAEKKYIELQKTLNVCEMHYEHCLEMHDWSGDATADNIKRDIENIPTADVVEVRHGKWESFEIPHMVRCSECGVSDLDIHRTKFVFCPYCGAKMDGRSDV